MWPRAICVVLTAFGRLVEASGTWGTVLSKVRAAGRTISMRAGSGHPIVQAVASKSRSIPHPFVTVSKVLFLEFRTRSEIRCKFKLHLELLAEVAVEWDHDA